VPSVATVLHSLLLVRIPLLCRCGLLYRRSSVVCLSVGRLICRNREPSKTGLNRSSCRLGCGLRWAKETMYVLDRGSRYPMWKGNFDGENVICTANGWLKEQDQQSSTTESELWRNAGPSASQLHETIRKSNKIWCTYLATNCVSLRTFWTPLVHLYLKFSVTLSFARSCNWPAGIQLAQATDSPWVDVLRPKIYQLFRQLTGSKNRN